MVGFWKSSRVHEQEENENNKDPKNTEHWDSFTVWRKSLICSCEGFTVIDCKGNLVYRVDNYIGRKTEEIVLMDGSGVPIHTMCRSKKVRLMDDWVVYKGDIGKGQPKEPICCMRKQMNMLQRPRINTLAQIYHGPLDKTRECRIEGSYANRSCRVLDKSMRMVAEIKRKEEIKGGVSFGVEVFVLLVRPGFSPNLAMAIVLLLDQMFS